MEKKISENHWCSFAIYGGLNVNILKGKNIFIVCYIVIVPQFQAGGFVAVAFLFEDFSSMFMYGEVFFYILMLLCPCFMEDRLWIKFESILVTLTDGVKKSTFARTCVHISLGPHTQAQMLPQGLCPFVHSPGE